MHRIDYFQGKNKKGLTLVEVLIVVGIIALLSATAIPNALRTRVNANDTSAKAILKSVAIALENYMSINSQYPSTTDELVTAVPPYIGTDYFNGVHSGFTFVADLQGQTYSVTGTPIDANHGSASFTITAAGTIVENE